MVNINGIKYNYKKYMERFGGETKKQKRQRTLLENGDPMGKFYKNKT